MKMTSMFAAALLAVSAAAADAQNFPTKPVHMYIGFPAGTSTDILARVLAQRLGDMWGQNVVSDNRAGAGSSIAATAVAKSTPDGYTLLFNSSAQSINPALYAKLPYDTLKDFVEIAMVASQPNILVVNPSSSIKSVADLIAEAKAKPGQINFGSAGVGTGTHLNLEKFKLMTGANVTHVPYKGTPEVVTDIIGGRTTAYFAPITAALPFVQSGKLRALAVSGAKRSAQVPDVPTVAEAGVKGFEFLLWFGVWGPSGMPANLVSKIASDINKVLASPELRDQYAKMSTEPLPMTTRRVREVRAQGDRRKRPHHQGCGHPAAMKHRQLGASGPRVSAIGLGRGSQAVKPGDAARKGIQRDDPARDRRRHHVVRQFRPLLEYAPRSAAGARDPGPPPQSADHHQVRQYRFARRQEGHQRQARLRVSRRARRA